MPSGSGRRSCRSRGSRSAADVVDRGARESVPADRRRRRQVLVRPRDETVGRRAKVAMGPANMHGHTIEADVRGTEQRRQRGDVGVINQRYALVLFGNGQKLELHPWQAADEMTVRVPFKWEPNTWYRMKLRVDDRPDGTAQLSRQGLAHGTTRACGVDDRKIDRIAHRGVARDLRGWNLSIAHFDNVAVYPHRGDRLEGVEGTEGHEGIT